MRRQTRSTSFDFVHPGIPGDELEQDRIQLEHDLQNTDLSFRLSSQGDVNDSIEYPRHNSGPLHDFGSFIHHSRGDFGDGDTHHGWSYRTGDDDDGINPYGGETMSTAAHHASALTLTAGLGGRGARRDISLSGAEYDPDRPLENIIGGVDSRFSLFDLDPSRSKYSAPGPGISFDPLVVDSTAELDRILESGHAPPPVPRSRDARTHFSQSSSSSSSSDSEGGPSSRPKIVDSLRRVSFSPKRPRVAHSAHSPRHRSSNPPSSTQSIINSARHITSPLIREASLSKVDEQNYPTPKARHVTKRPNNHSTAHPEVRLQPPTPSSTSKFTHKARGLTRELNAEAERTRTAQSKDKSIGDSLYTNAELSYISHDLPPATGTPAPKRPIPSQKFHGTPRFFQGHNISHSKLHLPDVTGLTNAVDSPAKGALNNHYPYQSSAEPREIEVRLLTVMNTIQDKLEQLEGENGISRRRVRELELELEMCKKDVARERTRVLQKEEAILQNQRELERAVADAKRNMKGKARARDTSMHAEADASVRYKEAVEEKKALESLITTLRSHLTRLTAELSSHQQLLVELRSLRESDARALKEKTADITRLSDEVERLAGEVEVLRGVVEEGLKERRLARENSRASESESQAQPEALEETEEASEIAVVEEEEEHQQEGGEEEDEEEEEELEEDEELEDHEEPEPFDPISIPGSSRDVDPFDKTVRTDRATVGTPGASQRNISRPTRFIEDEELERIATDVEERRSERSGFGGSRSQFDSMILNPSRTASPAPMPMATAQRRAIVENVADITESVRDLRFSAENAPPSPALSSASARLRRAALREAPESARDRPNRSSAPTPGHATTHNHRRSSRRTDPDDSIGETPFPQIRGERLEKLFFSAPEHNQQTCTVCCRHRGARGTHGRPTSPSWLPSRFRQDVGWRHYGAVEDDEDEGFVEGSEGADHENARDQFAREMKRRGKQRDLGPPRDSYEQRKNLPQQTVLARVIRELEDDFTHYKSVYVELADQYKDMDPVSDVPRRNLLAQHLREVVDILEQKGDQIASLYDLLAFKDKPVEPHSKLETRSAQAANALRAAGLGRHPTFA
ncbi:hypothetical protein J3R30DRAFT_3285901 [Lentinula aciculospora]|uniref:Cep57 centrosome microtubule-binding domain-containing protein n=1 Tax=Lentinula aciculospora TaxID=153920 RepID=A0A9W9AG99_9AGAR|nr:hypothetical protein J3R30DRAFT_3285901 [Lentinula aciculospora]